MHPAATLFFDVCVQRDLWPGGTWPLIDDEHAENVAKLFALAVEVGARQGGVLCAHGEERATPPDRPLHCRQNVEDDRPARCRPALPIQIGPKGEFAGGIDRHHATYVDSGCHLSPDDGPERRRAFLHLTAGVRDAVVFGAGIEYGVDRVVDALLRHRIRTHVVLDALGTEDEIAAQTIVARWKRRGVDGLTVDVVARLLGMRR